MPSWAYSQNTDNANERIGFFTLEDATDLVTPEDITVTGVKPTLYFANGSTATATNDIVKVAGSIGLYSHTLTKSESNTARGAGVAYLKPTGCAAVYMGFTTVPGVFDVQATPTDIADAFLDRNLATGTDSGSSTVRTVRQALRALRNRFTVSGGTATFYKEDDSTVSHTAVVTGTPAVTEANPAGGS